MTIHFLIDECLPHQIAKALTAEGHDCLLASAEFASQPDERIAEHAQRLRRIIVTEDDDFGELAVRRGVPTPGILYVDLPNVVLTRRVLKVIEVVRRYDTSLKGRLTTIGANKVRQREIPG